MITAKEKYEGRKYNRLTILKVVKNAKGRNKAICVCECGNKKEFYLSNIVPSGDKRITQSCGCLRRSNEWADDIRTVHNKSLHLTWIRFRRRCDNVNDISYKWYGARGIDYFSEWDNYETFRDWALSNGYESGLSIERIDVNKGYYPDNVTFIPLNEQSKNTRSTNVTIGGVTLTREKWSNIIGISKSALSNRLKQRASFHILLSPPKTRKYVRCENAIIDLIDQMDFNKGVSYYYIPLKKAISYYPKETIHEEIKKQLKAVLKEKNL